MFHVIFTYNIKILEKQHEQHITSRFRYTLLVVTSHKPGHFIVMVPCNDHKKDTVIDDLFNTADVLC